MATGQEAAFSYLGEVNINNADLSYGTDVAISSQVAGGAMTVTLPYIAGQTLYITDIIIVAAATGSSAQTVYATLNNTLGGTVPIAIPYPASGYQQTVIPINRAIPASAIGTSIYLSNPGVAGAACVVYLHGFSK